MPASGELCANWDLPESVRIVANVIGRAGAINLACACTDKAPPSRCVDAGPTKRGRAGCIYIPRKLKQRGDCRLVEILGIDDALKMIAAFGGEMLWFPLCHFTMIRPRNEALRERRAAGESVEILAFLFDMSARNVRKLCEGVVATSKSI